PSPSRFAYLAFCHVASSESEARRVGEKMMWWLRQGRPYFGAAIPAGFSSAERSCAAMSGELGGVRNLSFEELVEEGIMLIGTPDQVIDTIKSLYARTGVGNLLL